MFHTNNFFFFLPKYEINNNNVNIINKIINTISCLRES